MNPITVRPFAPADFGAWYPLWRGYQSFYKTDIPLEVSQETWRRLNDGAEPMHGAFAEVDGQPAGLVHYIEHRSCWTTGNYCYLQDLFVDDRLRGRGVGRMLIEHVAAAATAMGCSRLYWLTHETNTDAMQLYDRIGAKSGFIQYRKALSAV